MIASIRDLYIVELDDVELSVISLAGRLDRLMAELVASDLDEFLSTIGT